MMEDEELQLATKPYIGLTVFDTSNCLGYFSLESILANHIGYIATDKFVDIQVFTVIHHLDSNPEKLFYLMSVCSEEGLYMSGDCWQLTKKLRVTVNDVICVFLNWGATLETLGLESDKQLKSLFVSTQVPVVMKNFPAPHNVKAVLVAISNYLSNGEVEDTDQQKYNLLKVLMVASLDVKLREHRFRFTHTICKVLESFSTWTLDKVVEMVNHLGLMRLGLKNAVYICCSLFTTFPRVQVFKVVAIRHLLHIKFGLCPPLEPIQSLLDNVRQINEITERLPLSDIYFLIQLLNTLLVTWCGIPFQSSVAEENYLPVIEGFCNWAQFVHSELMVPTFLYTLEGGLIREKCVRFKADCVEIMRIYKNTYF